ncbi:MAG TPA: GYF domain-containing protein [Polyangiales bacterium]|nr:GYF domain-containing protein [Polyangiales bacterium]
MKFLCRNCKAKYQIADDKVVGRTLRMTCQQCGEPIVVRSSTVTSRSSSQVSRPMTLAGPGPSALGADFQRQISSPPRDVVQIEEWHVAINDVPVGPMRRDEVARKIAMNAVDRDSLAWREGMDDWLPIKHIAELAALFPGAVPPAAAAVTITGVPPAPAPAAPPPPPPAAIAVAPSARVDMAPVGGRQLHSVDEYSVPLVSEPAVAIQQLPSEAPAAAGGKPLGWGPMFALVSGGAFILAAGAFLGVRVLAPQPAAPTAVVSPAPTGPSKPSEAQANANDNNRGANVIELDVQPIDGQQRESAARRSAGTTPTTGTPPKKELTAEQKEMLARMGGGLEQGGPSLKAPADTPTRAQGGALTAEQLSAVVLRGRKNLQRCYETALRGTQSSDTVRLDVEIEVSPNGNVTTVKANGKGLPGMDECITRTVKMWRFPSSGEVTQTRFPVVFQPGA